MGECREMLPQPGNLSMFNPITFLKNKHYRNAEMVSYWKHGDSVEAKLTKARDGHAIMWMQGEKYAFSGIPRSVLLYGSLSPLKHQIKNKIFNESWKLLEDGVAEPQIHAHISTRLDEICALGARARFDMVPPEKLCPPVRELYRALTAIGCDTRLRDTITFILQEDDAYRFRFQWMTKFYPRFSKPTFKHFLNALSMLEQGEVVDDMKERERLFKRIMVFMLKDSAMFKQFLNEIDWKKIRLTKADKYFFRAKYFKVDWPEYQY